MKKCLKCKQYKPFSEFYINQAQKGGFGCWCKLCQSNYQKTKEGKVARKRYAQSRKGKCNQRKGNQKYFKSEKGKAIHRAKQKKYYANHPKVIKAQRAVNKAIKVGDIPSPKTKLCHYCSKPAQQYHHHKGYEPEYWFDIVPVCVECHFKYNRKVA